MSDVGLILNALLGVLLVGAILLGWRLEQRLKALRASHQSFTRAVEDLDRAAARAEQGLADLRAATDEAADTLAGRIERAKSLSVKLEKLSAEAVSAEARLAAQPRLAAWRLDRGDRAPARASEPAAPVRDREQGTAEALAELILDKEGAASPPPRRLAGVSRLERRSIEGGRASGSALERLRTAAQPTSLRARARADDDLFEAPDLRRTGSEGYR